MRPGLVRHQCRTEQSRGFFFHVIDRLDHFHAAGFAAAPGMDLRLDDPDRSAEFIGGLLGLVDVESRYAARHRHAEFAQYSLGLVFVDIHSDLSSIRTPCKRNDALSGDKETLFA